MTAGGAILDGRVALVTGSSRGIGAAIARTFARAGARVVVHGRDEAALAAVLDDIRREGASAIAVRGDVTSVDDLDRMRAEIAREFPWRFSSRNARRIPDAVQATLVDAHPLRRLGTTEDVAEAALFLASDRSAWITGSVVDVSGGAVMV